MKTFLLSLFFISYTHTALSFDIINCCSENEKPSLVRTNKIPASGPYVKVEPYYVTAGKNDPYTEEILFFIITKDLKNRLNYSKFHVFFKNKMELLEKKYQNDPGHIVGPKELYPLIYNYLKITGHELPLDIFNDYIQINTERINALKKVFAFKANTTYYKIEPEHTKAEIGIKGSLPFVTLKNEYGALRTTIATSKLTHYSSALDEQKEKDVLVQTHKEDLKFIFNSLPKEGSPLKKHLEKLLE